MTVNLPAKRGISRFCSTFCHRGDGRFLSVDVGDEVREFFSDTDTGTREGASVLELAFE
jgi:hypothetical protein